MKDWKKTSEHQATFLRQSAQCGMWAFQGSFPRRKEKNRYEEFGENNLMIIVSTPLFNFSTGLVGPNQIKSTFMQFTLKRGGKPFAKKFGNKLNSIILYHLVKYILKNNREPVSFPLYDHDAFDVHISARVASEDLLRAVAVIPILLYRVGKFELIECKLNPHRRS